MLFSREMKPESIASLDLQPAWERRDGLLLLHGLGMSYLPLAAVITAVSPMDTSKEPLFRKGSCHGGLL